MIKRNEDSRFLYLQEHLALMKNKLERMKYCKGLGEIWDEVISRDNVFLDKRDYNLYSIIEVGYQKWLGENIRIKIGNSTRPKEIENVLQGRLYDINSLYKACPEGFRLPTHDDKVYMNKHNLSNFTKYPCGYTYYKSNYIQPGNVDMFWIDNHNGDTYMYKYSYSERFDTWHTNSEERLTFRFIKI